MVDIKFIVSPFLQFIAQNPKIAADFFDSTGLEVEALRNYNEQEFGVAILHYLMHNEKILINLCNITQIDPTFISSLYHKYE